jgi:hypothetical protein
MLRAALVSIASIGLWRVLLRGWPPAPEPTRRAGS